MPLSYKRYTAGDFSNDNAFIRWQLFHTEEDDLFWMDFLALHPEKRKEIEDAAAILEKVRLNDYKLSHETKRQLWIDVERSIAVRKKRQSLRFLLSAAAGVAVLLTLAYFLFSHATREETSPLAQTTVWQLNPQTSEIKLELAGKEAIALEQNAVIRYDKETLTVSATNQQPASVIKLADDTVAWNKLTVPKGRRTTLVLADGTKIWVNSGSCLEFPARFDQAERAINLEGEIYLEVSKQAGRPFIVHTSSGMDIKVLGTRFDVSAYREDATHTVVLVEGAVEVRTASSQPVRLEADQALSFSSGKASTYNVNTYDYISWKDGLMQFHSEPLSSILTRLSRYYDTPLTYDERIKDMKCTGKLALFDDLDIVLQTITSTVPVAYEKEGGQIKFSGK